MEVGIVSCDTDITLMKPSLSALMAFHLVIFSHLTALLKSVSCPSFASGRLLPVIQDQGLVLYVPRNSPRPSSFLFIFHL